MNEKGRKLLEICSELPTDHEAVRSYIEVNKCDERTLTEVLLEYVRDCAGEYGDFVYEGSSIRELPYCEYYEIHRDAAENDLREMKSYYLYDLAKIFCEYGLQPDLIFDDLNLMEELIQVDYDLVAADILKLFFENGADVDLEIDDEKLFDKVDFDVYFGAVEQRLRIRFDVVVHCWMVMIGYGAKR